MKLLLFILDNKKKLDDLLVKMSLVGVHGGTIVDSKGMAKELLDHEDEEDFGFFSSLRNLIDPARKTNVTLLFAIEDELVEKAIAAIEEVVGDLDKPNTGVLMVLPISFIKGVKLKNER